MLGCNIGGLFVNVLDDMVLLAPSWHALQELIKILEYSCAIFLYSLRLVKQ